MNKLYRIHTEGGEFLGAHAINLTAGMFEAFNVTHNVGYWRGKSEESITIEIYGLASDAAHVETLAELIRNDNRQDAVLVASFDADTHLVTKRIA